MFYRPLKVGFMAYTVQYSLTGFGAIVWYKDVKGRLTFNRKDARLYKSYVECMP
jgi:hypothetical protein